MKFNLKKENENEPKIILSNIIKTYYDFFNEFNRYADSSNLWSIFEFEYNVKNDLEAKDLIVEYHEDYHITLDILYDEEKGEIVIRIYIINDCGGYVIETIDVDIDTIKSIENDKELSIYMMKTLLNFIQKEVI